MIINLFYVFRWQNTPIFLAIFFINCVIGLKFFKEIELSVNTFLLFCNTFLHFAFSASFVTLRGSGIALGAKKFIGEGFELQFLKNFPYLLFVTIADEHLVHGDVHRYISADGGESL